MRSSGIGRVARTSALAASFLLVGNTMPAAAETIMVKTITYFSVGGSTAAEIDRNMARVGPVSSVTGHRHPGATQIRFNGSATFVSNPKGCRIGGAKVRLSTKLRLPRWTNRPKADRDLALVWDTLAADIKRHEERHAEIARNHARALEKAILSVPPGRNCAILKKKVNEISQAAMLAHEKDQQRFDRIEGINFSDRMLRLLKYRLKSRKPS